MLLILMILSRSIEEAVGKGKMISVMKRLLTFRPRGYLIVSELHLVVGEVVLQLLDTLLGKLG
jgi:hypothetical protein